MRAVTISDEDWTEEDQMAALEWQTEQALKCSGCGLPSDETTAVGRDDDWDAEVVQCHACAARDRTQRSHLQQSNAETAGLKVRVYETG